MEMTGLVSETDNEAHLIGEGRKLLAALVAEDEWLPDAFAKQAASRYAQYLMHCDPLERFSIVSFV